MKPTKTFYIILSLIFCMFNTNKPTSAQNDITRLNGQHEISALNFASNYLSALNSGRRKIMKDFLNKNADKNLLEKIPPETLTTFNLAHYYETGGLGYDFLETDSADNNLIKIKLVNRLTLAKLILEIPVTGEKEFRINGMVSGEIQEHENNNLHAHVLTDEDIAEKLEKCLLQLEKDNEFSGVVLLAKNGQPVIKRAVGKASIAYEIPNLTDTKFNLASVGKIFTGLAITQLAEQGKLKIDDTIDKYLPSGWLPNEISGKIQIKHLLTHTSGLSDYFADIYKQCEIQVFRELNDYKPLVYKSQPAFEPGKRFSYSNTGYLLLGVVIESVSGEEYFQYLTNHIFIPAGMKNTGGFAKDQPVKNRATGYTKIWQDDDFTWTDHMGTRILKGCPSGGIYSTAEDLLQFDIALRNHKLLSPEYTQLLFTGFPELNASFHSTGFFLSDNRSGKTASHSGDGSGVNCQYKMCLDSGYTIIILSNYSPPSANIVANVTDQLMIHKTGN